MSSSLASPITVDFLEDSTAYIMCRVEGRATSPNSRGTPYLQANLSAIALSVYDITDETAPVVVSGFSASTLTVSAVIFDTLQAWSVDNIGANFAYALGPTAFPTGGNKYRVTVKWTHTDGSIGHTQWEGVAQAVDPS